MTRPYWQQIIMLVGLTLAMTLPGLASLPIIDRDEARYVQATVQMADTGDVMNIKFQDQARNKKPAGIYWLQLAAIKTFSSPEKREIWVHRLPSVLGALLAVLATFWGGAKLIGRDRAFISAALLATSLLFVFEAHIAKTDALLCGLSACIFAALADLRVSSSRTSKGTIWLFWLALGASIMVKGPIILAILSVTLIGFWIWERDLSWTRPLLRPLPITVFFLIWLPWAISIYVITDGAFFKESLGQDLSGKLITAQEKHPGPPGYHTGLIWVMLWPASLFLLPACISMIKTLRRKQAELPQDYKALQLCFLWIAPFWALIEFMPTKLPHYSLPLYPAICIMIGASLSSLTPLVRPNNVNQTDFKKSKIANLVLFLPASFIIFGALIYLSLEYGKQKQLAVAILMTVLAGSVSLYAAVAMIKNKTALAIKGLIIAALIVSFSGYKLILANLDSFNTSARIAAALDTNLPRLSGKTLLSPHYKEPSLVYHLGRDIKLGGAIEPIDIHALNAGHIILIDKLTQNQNYKLAELNLLARGNNICLDISKPISGFNYSKGDNVEIYIVQKANCN